MDVVLCAAPAHESNTYNLLGPIEEDHNAILEPQLEALLAARGRPGPLCP